MPGMSLPRWGVLVLGLVLLTVVLCVPRTAPPHKAPAPVTDAVKGWRKIHVFVALCDNVHQGIVPVPAAIGNGQDPARNLYWGCGSGVKTYFTRSAAWRRLAVVPHPKPHVLERLIFQHATQHVYLVADAYDGAAIQDAMRATLTAASGAAPEAVLIAGHHFAFAGGADVVAYIGHNGLMDAALPMTFAPHKGAEKPVILLACASSQYFGDYLHAAHAYPLLWTTNLMCPEAYTLHDALTGWIAHEKPAQIQARAAQAYSAHQQCSVRAATRLLKTGW